MEKNEITPSLRLDDHQTTSDFDKADITHIETGRVGVAALEDETLMSGESQERVRADALIFYIQLADAVAHFLCCLPVVRCRGLRILLWLRHRGYLSVSCVNQG